MAYKIGGWIGSIQQAVPEKPTAQPPNFFGKVGFLREKKTPFHFIPAFPVGCSSS
jgi:hypothetical protein|tara:strand:+ start:128 stop:292 length:165 start_codon:yes stop_codon:yes gene_type:complete